MIKIDIEHRATAEMRVLLATINMALMDACIKPERGMRHDIAMDAHDFLWGKRLESFLHYTNMEPSWFRSRLTELMQDRSAGYKNGFSSDQRRLFRANRRLYARLGSSIKLIEEYDVDLPDLC